MQLLEKLVSDYLNIHCEGVEFHLPYYCIIDDLENQGKTFGRFEGKGTANQLNYEIQLLIKKHPEFLRYTSADITKILKQEGIGVDCSGYVYNILDEYVHAVKGTRLDYLIKRPTRLPSYIDLFFYTKNRVRKISSKALTSKINTTIIRNVKDIHAGDMIRLTHGNYEGKHVALIISITEKEIIYTHSSDSLNMTSEEGPHLSVIEIINPQFGLEKQLWKEKTKKGLNYGKECFIPSNDDYVCRLHSLMI